MVLKLWKSISKIKGLDTGGSRSYEAQKCYSNK